MLFKIILLFLLLSLSTLTSQANVEDIISSIEITEADTEKKLLLNKDKNELYIFSNYKIFIVDSTTNQLKNIVGIPINVDSVQLDKLSGKIYMFGSEQPTNSESDESTDSQPTNRLIEFNPDNIQLNILSVDDDIYSLLNICSGESILLNSSNSKIIRLNDSFQKEELISILKSPNIILSSAVNNKSQNFIILYVPRFFSSYTLSSIDCREGNIKRKNRIRVFPSYLIINEKKNLISLASTSRVYNLDGNTLKTISSGQLTGSGSIIKIISNEEDGLLYILRSSSVEIYNTITNQSISNIKVDDVFSSLTNIEIDKNFNKAFITSQFSGIIKVIDLKQKRIIDYIFSDNGFDLQITLNEDKGDLFFTSRNLNKLFNIDYRSVSNLNPFFYQRFKQIADELSNLNPKIANDAPDYSNYVNKYITYLNSLNGSKCISNINKKPSPINQVGSISITTPVIATSTSKDFINSYNKIINLISLAEIIVGLDLNKNGVSEICEF